jgi:hypothetical protein
VLVAVLSRGALIDTYYEKMYPLACSGLCGMAAETVSLPSRTSILREALPFLVRV